MDSIFQLSMEIFDTKSSKVVYNKRWQTNWKDLATIKDDLSDNILETLEIEVIRDVEDQIVESNPEAYEYYLKGKYKFEKRVSIEDLEIARGFFQKAIELDSSLLKAMIALAKTYRFTNEYDRSIEIYNKALKRSEELNNKVQKAYALNGLGTSYIYRDGDLDKALEYYEKGSELAKETGDKTLNTFFLNNIAIIHNRRGDSEKALEMMEELLTIVEDLDDKTGQVFALNNIGFVYAAKGEKDRSNDYYKRSLSLSREIGDKGMEGFTLANIGNYHMGEKQYDLAIKLFKESLEIYKKLGDKEGQITSLTQIGNAEMQSGKHETGFETLNRALELSIEIDNKISIIESNTAISQYYKAVENYREALNYLFVANKKIKELNAPDRLAYNLYEIGDVYHVSGDVDSAIEYHKRSKDIQEELGNMPAVAYLFLELGRCYVTKGDTGPVLDFIEKSISLSKEINDSYLSGWGQFWAGFVYYQKKDYETAVDKYMDKAIVLSKEKEDNFGLFRTAIYFLCLKELNREYDLSEFHKLIEEEEDIDWSSNYYIYKLLGERSYIKDAYDKVIKLHSNLEPEVAEKFIDYPLVKAVIEEWKMNI